MSALLEGWMRRWACVLLFWGVGTIVGRWTPCRPLPAADTTCMCRPCFLTLFGPSPRPRAPTPPTHTPSWFDLDENNSGRLVTVLSTDATYVRGAVVDVAGVLIQNVSCLAVGYAIAAVYDWRVALLVTAVVPLVAVGGYFNMQFVMVRGGVCLYGVRGGVCLCGARGCVLVWGASHCCACTGCRGIRRVFRVAGCARQHAAGGCTRVALVLPELTRSLPHASTPQGTTDRSEKIYGSANTTVSEAFASVRVIHAYNLGGHVTGECVGGAQRLACWRLGRALGAHGKGCCPRARHTHACTFPGRPRGRSAGPMFSMSGAPHGQPG